MKFRQHDLQSLPYGIWIYDTNSRTISVRYKEYLHKVSIIPSIISARHFHNLWWCIIKIVFKNSSDDLFNIDLVLIKLFFLLNYKFGITLVYIMYNFGIKFPYMKLIKFLLFVYLLCLLMHR
jgi:hypothetical protein